MRRYFSRFARGCILWLLALLLLTAGCAPSRSPENFRSPIRKTPPPAVVTPAPTVPETIPEVPEPVIESGELQFGARGEEVQKLQARLIELGYLLREMPDDYFDIEVEGAVKLFQKAAELEVTGVAGIATLSRLFASDAPEKKTAFPPQDPLAPGAAGRDITMPKTPAPGGTPVRVTPAPTAAGENAGMSIRIGLDPGHQARGNSAQEPVAPGASTTKNKVTTGTSGTVSGVDESVVNLSVALKVRDLLQAQGVETVMTRETNDVDISNAERAQKMNEANVDLVVRLHCNGDSNADRSGAFVLIPSGSYTTDIQAESRAAAEDVLAAYIEATGAKNLGLSERSDQTGFNWSTVPVINIEMGHMSNPAEDRLLTSAAYQEKMAQGIAQGILNHFR